MQEELQYIYVHTQNSEVNFLLYLRICFVKFLQDKFVSKCQNINF